ncbi:MAG: lasso peptide biosynthesis B2 protein [Pseudonocardiaceae bacterium]
MSSWCSLPDDDAATSAARLLCTRTRIAVHHASGQQAHMIVTSVSLRCSSGHGCLQRSLAIVLPCRMAGQRVTWRVGFRSPPPQSHAWVEANDRPVEELIDPHQIYTPVITV